MRRIIKAALGLALVLTMMASMTSIASAKGTSSIQVYGNIKISGRAAEFYHVIYDANGGMGSCVGPNVTAGGSDTVLSPAVTGISRDGCVFVGWNTAADGSGAHCAPGDSITLISNVILYAQWAASEIVMAPKTGDINSIRLLCGILCVSFMALVLLIRRAQIIP